MLGILDKVSFPNQSIISELTDALTMYANINWVVVHFLSFYLFNYLFIGLKLLIFFLKNTVAELSIVST